MRRNPLGLWCVFCLSVLIEATTTIYAEAATTYYVGKSGSDANSCATAQSSTAANRKLTIAGGLGCLSASAGDTLIIGDGTYVESLDDLTPSGGGTEGTRTIVKCENVRACTLDASFYAWRFVNSDTNWITIQDMVICCGASVLIANNTTSSLPTTDFPHHMRYQNNEIHTSDIYCIYTGHGDDLEFLNNYIHGCQEQHFYGLSRNSTYRGNTIDGTGQKAGQMGLEFHNSGGMQPSGNLIEENICHATTHACYLTANSPNNVWRRNIAYGAGFGFAALDDVATDANDWEHNVAYNTVTGFDFAIGSATNNRFRNNIALGNTANASICAGCGTQTTNLFSGTATDVWTSPSTNDFTLKSGSPAIDAGTYIGLPYNGPAPDQGYLETAGSTPSTASPLFRRR